MRAHRQPFPFTRLVGALRSFLGTGVPVVTRLSQGCRPDPFMVLVGTILSLRTRDEQTDQAMERVRPFITGPADIIAMPVERIEELIYPVGFYRVKAATLKEIARVLLDRHDGRVPSSMDELLAIRGVGRKTANLVLAEAFGIPAICVDTHVHRISNRFGLVDTRHPHETEEALRASLPRRFWTVWNTLLVSFGQRICTPLSPRCSICPVTGFCAQKGVNRHR